MMRRNISGDRYNKINDSLNVKFGHRVAKLAKKTHVDAVISYDNNSMTLFSDLKRMSPETIRILDVSAANRIYMKEIYKSDLQLSPDFADKLKEECPIIESEKVCERVQKEIELSQYFLVGSSFVKKSLEYSGVKSEQIYICPYGVDTSKFYRKALKIRTESEPIRFVFVGGTKQLKGLSYMLQAFQKVDHTKATFTIIGADNLYEKLKEKYAKDVNFAGMILHDKMPEVLQDYDVMVFPSLGEGFSLSMVEAMACGLPVISSTNTGANDFIENSKNGFIVPIQDTDALVDKMQWFIKHHEEIPRMGKNAIKTASALTWDNYHKKVAAAIREIVEHEKESRFAG
jgi:glycosyltransferase involved in cell wall biosynthesis